MAKLQRTFVWFLHSQHSQTVHQNQRQVVLELTNELATFLTVHAVDSDVEANPEIKKIGNGK